MSWWRSGTTKSAPNGETVVAIPVIGRIDAAAVEVQVVAVGGTIRGRGPVDALATDAVHRPVVVMDVPGRELLTKRSRESLYIYC